MPRHLADKRGPDLGPLEMPFLRALMEAPDGFLIREGRTVIAVNQALFCMLGYDSAAELIGRDVVEFIHPDFRREAQERMRRMGGVHTAPLWETQLLRRDGSALSVAAVATPWSLGERKGAFVFIKDLSERRRHQREVQAAADRERRRIGQDLHDDIGHPLTILSGRLFRLEEKLRGAGRPAEAGELASLQRYVREAMEQSRRIARDLAEPPMTAEQLAEGLVRLAEDAREAFGLRATATADRELPLEPAVAGQLYRIAEEALHNAARHAGAKRVELRLARKKGVVELSVVDDGRWAPVKDGEGGVGLGTMQHRAVSAGGILTFRKRPGGGTAVVCKIETP